MSSRTRTMKMLAPVLVLSILGGFSCSDDPAPNRPPVPFESTPDADLSPDTRSDVEVDPCAAIDCQEGFSCVNGTCEVVRPEGSSCAQPFDLGTLIPGEPLEASADPTGWENLLNTGCSEDDASPQGVFSFKVDVNARVRVNMTESTEPIVMEVRGSCADVDSALSCDTNVREFDGQAGTTYFLVVEARRGFGVGPFKVELSATEQVCGPAGSWSCDGDQRVQCFAGEEERPFQCAAACADGACEGDVCATAIEVTGSMTVTGDSAAHESRFDFADQPSCSTARTTGPRSPGQDVVFRLPGLSAGQTVTVDTTNQTNVNVIALLRSCAADAGCVAANDTTGLLSWVVDEDGDYFLVIDKVTSSNTAFDYRIEILD